MRTLSFENQWEDSWKRLNPSRSGRLKPIRSRTNGSARDVSLGPQATAEFLVLDAEGPWERARLEEALERQVLVIVRVSPRTNRRTLLDLIRNGAVSCISEGEADRLDRVLAEVQAASAKGVLGLWEHLEERLERVGLGDGGTKRGVSILFSEVGRAVAEGAQIRVLKHPRIRWRLF
jgi:hypothetical protein